MSNEEAFSNIHIPYNNDIDLIDLFYEIKPKANLFFYFAPSPNLTPSGRRLPNINKFVENSKFSEELFNKQISIFLLKCKKYGFNTNLLLNNVLLGLPYSNSDLKIKINQIQSYIEKLDKQEQIDYITISNPYLIELLDFRKIKNIKLKLSVNFQLKSYKSINYLQNIIDNWSNKGVVAEVEIHKDLLRNIDALKKIKHQLKNPLIKLSIIVNEGCLNDCPYQLSHQIHSCSIPINDTLSYDGKFNFGIAKCKHITAIEPWSILDSNWVLPRHLNRYYGIVDSIKLTDRTSDSETIIKVYKAYLRNDYDTNNINKLISLLRLESWEFPEQVLPLDFDEKIFNCDDDNTDYYKGIWRNIVEYNKEKGVNTKIGLKGHWKTKLWKYIKD